ncbi:hypothetical protein TGVAND_438940 [Toxoplasma gondii VAND]|uniref:Secreted protein n=1 Tax=Toxoplasma gondii VAND TaxID=933077 RepID=A0A086PFX2_TOXGO|nr:hypothetical protein TGVAND_438940 [Toxoplasma gondii VAND]
MRFVGCMRGWVRGYWLCVVMQSVWEMVDRFVQAREVRDQNDSGACGFVGSRRKRCVGGVAMCRFRRRWQPEVRRRSGRNCRRVGCGGATCSGRCMVCDSSSACADG